MLSPAAMVQRAPMKRFDAEFRDLDHYIRVITDRIWEGRRIEDIRRYYSDPCIVETPSSVSTSVQTVIDGTKATLAMFPDRRLLAEDIIVSGDEEGGFLSSHRIISPMTHLGDGNFGKATGRTLQVRTIADCVCKDNRIVHEWLVRDHAAIALQLGSTPQALAQRWLNERGGWHKPVAGPAPAGYVSHISTDSLAQGYAQAIEDFAAGRDASAAYDEAVHHLGPGGSTAYGRVQVAQFWQGLFGALVSQAFQIEHLAVQRGGGRPDRIALRFRAKTLHGQRRMDSERYGKNSNRAVEVMGICHAECVQGRILREWVLIDDVAIWMQILTPQAAAAPQSLTTT